MLLSSFCSSLGRCCWFSGARSGSFVATIIVAASSEATIWREKAILETVGQPKEESKKEEEREREQLVGRCAGCCELQTTVSRHFSPLARTIELLKRAHDTYAIM